jgi:hypothetical protein
MPQITHLDEYGLQRLKDLEARVDLLERHNPLDVSSVRNGQIKLLDANGNAIVVLGQQANGHHGIAVQDVNGQQVFTVTSEDGQLFPRALIPVTNTTSCLLSGNAAQGFRPGTSSASFLPLWIGRFSSVGPIVDYDLECYANGGNMSWQITCNEFGMSDVVVVGPNTETTNVQRTGTFTLGASNILSGSDPAGRQMVFKVFARINSGATTADVTLNNVPTNHN